MNVDFGHRLESYDLKDPRLCSLVDAVHLSSDRTESAITALQGYFVDEDSSIDDETIFNILELIRFNIIDIGKMVQHFHEAQKNPSK